MSYRPPGAAESNVLVAAESVAVMASDKEQHQQRLSEEAWFNALPVLDAPLNAAAFDQFSYVLAASKEGSWSVCSRNTRGELQRVSIDFSSLSLLRRISPPRIGSEAVVKAVIGRERRNKPIVLDATAGFGTDALLLAAAGCEVVAVERSPLLAFLWRQALGNAQDTADDSLRAALSRLTFKEYDSMELLDNWALSWRPDVVYLDPMFPERSKSAAVKKGMQLLHELIGVDDAAADALLESAMRLASKRVVVKRSPTASVLAGRAPASSSKGKAARFDIYPL